MQKERASKRPVGSAGAITDTCRGFSDGSGAFGGVERKRGGIRREIVAAGASLAPAGRGQKEAELATGTVDEPTRRDFIVIAAQAFAGVGAAVALWPFIQQMNPDASTQALASIEVDLSPVKEGQAITVSWRGKPVFVRNRTAQEVQSAKEVKLADLVDRSARNDALPENTPATDPNRTKKGKENWIVLVGICTHLGCIPKGQSLNDSRGDYGGWFCPCHGSHYDTAGRIRRGPAPRNLEVPTYEFVSDSKIKIG
jgi:ubiquinol-cytochrome c reductase iron-sulfur subunit